MLDRLYINSEDLWPWLDDTLDELDEDLLWLIHEWGLDEGDIHPQQELVALALGDDRLVGTGAAWGVPPPWEPHAAPLLTVSSEAALHDPLFARWLGAGRRCIVPASAYYARDRPGVRHRLASGEVMPLAALLGTDADGFVGCAILTAGAGDVVTATDDSQPVIVPNQYVPRWLDSAIRTHESLQDLLRPPEPGSLVAESSSVG